MVNLDEYQIDNSLYEKLQKVDELKEFIQSSNNLKSNQLFKIKKKLFSQILYQNELIHQSKLTLGEIEHLIFFDRAGEKSPFSEYNRCYRKLKALYFLENEASNYPESFSNQIIHHLYLLLFWEENNFDVNELSFPYRESVALVEGDDFFSFNLPPVSEIPFQLQNLIDEYHSKRASFHTVLLSALFQYHFLTISPFKKNNEEISYYLFQYCLMADGYPPLILDSTNRIKYRYAIKNAREKKFYTLFNLVLDEALFTFRYIQELLRKNSEHPEKNYDDDANSLYQAIESTDKTVKRIRLQKDIDLKGIQDVMTLFHDYTEHYFIEHQFDEILIHFKRMSLKEIEYSYLLHNHLENNEIKPLWKSVPGAEKGSYVYQDIIDSVISIELSSNRLYIPTCRIYFGVIPTREANYIFSIQHSSYLDFKREERFPKYLSFFRSKKGGISLDEWEITEISRFFELSMKEFIDEMAEKITERKRILKH